MAKTKKFNFSKFLITLLITQAAGFVGSLFTTSSVKNWYPTINKPIFTPPSWLFAPVWIFLFFLMGISLYLIWQKGQKIIFFWIQLFLNVLWSFCFFFLQNPTLAFVEILILLIFILVTIFKSYKINKVASILFLPYLFWVAFASFLNYHIAILN